MLLSGECLKKCLQTYLSDTQSLKEMCFAVTLGKDGLQPPELKKRNMSSSNATFYMSR